MQAVRSRHIRSRIELSRHIRGPRSPHIEKMRSVSLYLYDSVIDVPQIEFELFNSETNPVRVRHHEDVGFEGLPSEIHREKGVIKVAVWFGRPNRPLGGYRHVLIGEKTEVTKEPATNKASSTSYEHAKTIELNVPYEHDVYLCVRMYRNDLDGGWTRCGDVTFSAVEMFEFSGISKPVYPRALMLGREGRDIAKRTEYQGLCVAECINLDRRYRLNTRVPGVMEGHPIHLLRRMDMCRSHEINHLKSLPISKSIARFGDNRHCAPFFYAVPGIGETYSYSGKALFYWDREHPAATEGWYFARLKEVLAVRGISQDLFEAKVAHATRAEQLTDEFKECLEIAGEVLRMHCASRPYVPDHAEIDEYKVPIDEDTMGLALPGDCEDNTMATYQLYMTLLFSHWTNSSVKCLRKCAAMLGIPCAVAGTYDNPKDVHPKDDSGHWYLVGIPFLYFPCEDPLFSKALLVETFRAMFDFDPPVFHKKTAVFDTIMMTTLFYGSHHDISEEKKELHLRVDSWMEPVGNNDWASVEPLTMTHQAQGFAFRLFTDFFIHIGLFSCCSFYFESVLQPETARAVYYANYGKNNEDGTVLRLFDLSTNGGIGIPIYLLTCPMNKPTYKVVPLFSFDANEALLRRAYSRPIVPLTETYRNAFREENEEEQSLATPMRDQRTTRDRFFLYCYSAHTLNKELEAVTNLVGKGKPDVFRYANGYALVFYL